MKFGDDTLLILVKDPLTKNFAYTQKVETHIYTQIHTHTHTHTHRQTHENLNNFLPKECLIGA